MAAPPLNYAQFFPIVDNVSFRRYKGVILRYKNPTMAKQAYENISTGRIEYILGYEDANMSLEAVPFFNPEAMH